MMHKSRKLEGKPGFTLLELIVVLLVLAVISAIAVPTFQRVKDNTAAGVVNTMLETAKRNGEAIAVSDLNISDENLVAAVASEFPEQDGITVEIDPPGTLVISSDKGSTPISGHVTFSGGKGTITYAGSSGGGSSSAGGLGLSYLSTTFSSAQSLQTLSPTVTGGTAASFEITSGVLPAGMSFDTGTGVFTGAAAWNFRATQVGAGDIYNCALVTDGTVKCWGWGWGGRLGNGSTADSGAPVTVSGISTATALSVGSDYSCAVLANGTIKCWGDNGQGRLGDGTTTSSSSPVTVSGISTAVAVSAGNTHTCAVLANGTIKCWGDNGNGQLGDGTTSSSLTPVTVSGISTATSVSVGGYHTCAVLANGTGRCWGFNNLSQLGTGLHGNSYSSPQQIVASGSIADASPAVLGGITRIAAGFTHNCALLNSGAVKCWGGNYSGELGTGGTPSVSALPIAASGISTAVGIATDANSAAMCALLADGTVKCWGWNGYGQIDGDPAGANRLTPVTVPGISGATAVSYGGYHGCVLRADGAVDCWGVDWGGQLGDGIDGGTFRSSVRLTGSGANTGFPLNLTVRVTGSDSSTATANITLYVN